jgi:hypothetical protein
VKIKEGMDKKIKIVRRRRSRVEERSKWRGGEDQE